MNNSNLTSVLANLVKAKAYLFKETNNMKENACFIDLAFNEIETALFAIAEMLIQEDRSDKISECENLWNEDRNCKDCRDTKEECDKCKNKWCNSCDESLKFRDCDSDTVEDEDNECSGDCKDCINNEYTFSSWFGKDKNDPEFLKVLANKCYKEIYDADYNGIPALTKSEIAESLDAPEDTIEPALKELLETKQIINRKVGNNEIYSIA